MAGVTIPITAPSTSAVTSIQGVNTALNNMGATAAAANAKLNGATGSTSNLGAAGQKAAAAMGPLGGILGRISPQAGAAASSIAGLASAGQGLAAAGTAAGLSMGTMVAVLGPVAVAVGALAAVYYTLNQNMEDVEARNKAAADTATAAQTDAEKRAALLKKIADDYAVASGATTTADQQAARQKEELREAYKAQLAAATAVNDAARKAAAGAGAGSDAAKNYQRTQAALQGLNDQLEVNGELIDEALRLDKAKGKAAQDKLQTDKDEAERLRKEAEDLAAKKAAVEAVAAAEKALQDITRTAYLSNMDALEREDAAYKDKLAAIQAAYTAGKNAQMDTQQLNDETSTALQAATQEHEANITRIELSEQVKRAADAQAFRDEQAAADAQAFAEKMDTARSYYTAANALSRMLVDATSRDYDTTTAAGKEAAKKQFIAQKAVAVALSIVQGALAVVQAIGSAPPPFNIPAIVATGIAVTAETATIAAQQPKFHTGTTNARRPDEFSATLQNGEGVVTSQGMSKPGMRDAVRAANAGQTPAVSGPSQPAVIQFRHKVYNRFMRENLRAGGPLADKFTLGKKIGHREVRT